MNVSRNCARRPDVAFCAFFLLGLSQGVFGQQGSLLIQADVRSRGMGEVAAPLPDNPMGFVSNPALLAATNTAFGRFSMADWNPIIPREDYDVYAGAAGISLGPLVNIGAAVHEFDWGSHLATDEVGNPTGEFHPYDLAAYIGCAVAPTPWFSAGLNVKYVRVATTLFWEGDVSENDVGLDVGLLFRNLLPNLTFRDESTDFDQYMGEFRGFLKAQSHPRYSGLSFGAALLNIGPILKFEDAIRSDPLPRRLIMGFSWLLLDTDPVGVLVAADVDRFLFGHIGTIYENVDYHFGGEFYLMRIITLRLGYVSMAYGSPNYPTVGASVGVDRVHLDVSYIPDSQDAGPFAETFAWGLTVNW